MKTKVLFAIAAIAFSFAVTSCGNKKVADADVADGVSCCAAQTEQVCDSAKVYCHSDSMACPKAACSQADCPKAACPKANCPKANCDGAKCDNACEKK